MSQTPHPAEARVRGILRGGYVDGDRFRYMGRIGDGWQDVALAECDDVRVHEDTEAPQTSLAI